MCIRDSPISLILFQTHLISFCSYKLSFYICSCLSSSTCLHKVCSEFYHLWHFPVKSYFPQHRSSLPFPPQKAMQKSPEASAGSIDVYKRQVHWLTVPNIRPVKQNPGSNGSSFPVYFLTYLFLPARKLFPSSERFCGLESDTFYLHFSTQR